MKIKMVKVPENVIDISYCNSPDWSAVKKSGVSAVIIRAGYYSNGFWKTDTKFHEHIKNAILHGLNIGIYCYIMSDTVEQARTEARNVLYVCKQYIPNINYPIFADMEHNKYCDKSKRELNTKILRAFCSEIEKSGKYLAGVYLNPAFRSSYINYSSIKPYYNIWLAHWTDRKSSYIDDNTTMWQYGTANYNGAEIDSSYCYVDYPNLTKMFRRGG